MVRRWSTAVHLFKFVRLYSSLRYSQQQSKLLSAFHDFEETNRRIDLDRNSSSLEFKSFLLESLQDLGKRTPQSVWADRLSLLPPSMTSFAVLSKRVAEEQRFLQSLRFEEIRRRWINVVSAHHETFEWVFKDTASLEHGNTKIGFKDWLLDENGHFWFEGKAGSGKSTLMKFICRHAKTEEYLSSWASRVNKKLVTAKFFFWHSGTALEKSQEGLLRSLLFEILSKCPDLIPKVRPDGFPSPDAGYCDWTREELFAAFQKLTTQHLSFRFCFFIDGLDEYGGHHAELIQTLQELMTLPDVKICLSSRPWQPFRDAFGKFSNRTTRLQDLTRGDIRCYVTDTFMKDQIFQRMATNDPEYSSLVEEVVNRAEGVFLWVFLVVRSLLDGIHERDLMLGLHYRLDHLPRNLEDFFRHMIGQIDDAYLRSRTAKAFQLALASPEPPLLTTYCIVDEFEGSHGQNHGHQNSNETSLQYYTQMKETMEIRLDARCKGLLEVSKSHGNRSCSSSFFDDTVVFLHRTVRDFLNVNAHEIFGEESQDGWNTAFTLCRALGHTIDIASKEELKAEQQNDCKNLVDELFYHSHQLAIHDHASDLNSACVRILRNTEIALQSSTWWQWRRKNAAFVGCAVEWDLRDFVQAQITARPHLLKTRERPLLDRALRPSRTRYTNEVLRSVAMVDMLLAAQANPNAKYIDETIWVRFLEELISHSSTAKNTNVVDIIKSLIKAGADTRVVVKRKEKYTVPGTKPRLTGRGSDVYKHETLPKEATRVMASMTVDDLLKDMFGSERCAYFMSARPLRKPTAWQMVCAGSSWLRSKARREN